MPVQHGPKKTIAVGRFDAGGAAKYGGAAENGSAVVSGARFMLEAGAQVLRKEAGK